MNIILTRYFSIAIGILAYTNVSADTKPSVVKLEGTYEMHLDRAKQTFNGTPITTNRPTTQIEQFSTSCSQSVCIAHSINKRPPPAVFDYLWNDGHWESVEEQQKQFFFCNDGSKVKSIKFDIIKPNADGSFTGERTILVKGKGCPTEGLGSYKLPFTLIPIKPNK